MPPPHRRPEFNGGTLMLGPDDLAEWQRRDPEGFARYLAWAEAWWDARVARLQWLRADWPWLRLPDFTDDPRPLKPLEDRLPSAWASAP